MKERKREETKILNCAAKFQLVKKKLNIVCLIDISREIKREEQETHPIQFPL